MIRAVRMAAGSQWNPPAVRLESPKSHWALRTEGLAQSRVDFGGPVLAIAIPHDLLDRRLPRPPSGRTATEEAGAPASDLAGSLLQALVPLATEVPLSLDLGAEIAETTPRTLQRWLAEEVTDWRQIVNRAQRSPPQIGISGCVPGLAGSICGRQVKRKRSNRLRDAWRRKDRKGILW
jgi:hypothetical protein